VIVLSNGGTGGAKQGIGEFTGVRKKERRPRRKRLQENSRSAASTEEKQLLTFSINYHA